MDVFVDLTDFIDVGAEISRNEKQEEKLAGFIKAKEAKLASSGFADRAPPDVVAKERASLAELQEQLAAVRAALADLRASR
jgi:valyl-tRNA synthetase